MCLASLHPAGKYVIIGENCVLRPSYKKYKARSRHCSKGTLQADADRDFTKYVWKNSPKSKPDFSAEKYGLLC